MSTSATTCFKDFTIAPLSGGLDTRSPSGKVSFNDFRLILNMDGVEERGYCRLGGWQPYLRDSEFGFKNQDLHDQMVGGQFYNTPYDVTTPGSSEQVGVQYPVFYPGHYVPDFSIPGDPIGPYCGYAPDQPYLFGNVANGLGISSWSAGHPYNLVLDAGCVGDPDTWIKWAIDIRSTAFSLAEELVEADVTYDSAIFGSGTVHVEETDDHIEIHYLTVCLPPDANNVQVINVVGNFLHIVQLGGGDYTCDGPDTPEAPCLTEDCYQGSYYYLTYTFEYPGYDVPAYYGGDPVFVYETTPASTVELCGELDSVPNVCREAITGLFSMDSIGGRRRLIATTRSRIYANDDRGGNWRILADGLGGRCGQPNDCDCSDKRIKMAGEGNTMLFANGIDPVIVWSFDEGPSGCFFWSADYVAELRQLGISTAKVVQCWKGFAFIGNVVQDGEKRTSRLFWSDYNAQTSWTPGGESLAGYHDFGNGEAMLSMEPIGGRLRIYTDKAIYDAVLVNDERIFSFQEIYRGADVLRYPNTLVNMGDSHAYFGESSIFVLAEADRTPQRIPWAHRACGAVFLGVREEWVQDFDGLDAFGPINSENCENAVGGWDSENKALWFSWPTDDNQCPNMSLVLWPRYQKATLVDHGFTAFVMHKPDFGLSIRQFLADQNICDPANLIVDKEGLPYDLNGESTYSYLYNETESPDDPRSPDSVIASLCGICVADLCARCEVDRKFLMASAEDYTIKEFTPDQFVREMLVSQTDETFPETGEATYEDVGYFSMMQGDPNDFRVAVEKLVNAITLTYNAAEQTEPNLMNVQVSYGPSPECQSWADSDPVDLACLDGGDADPDENERPAIIPRFAFYNAGVFLGWRFWTDGTGGQFCINSMTLSIRKSQGQW